jgi:sugar lactone lactonase YvrE
MQSLLQRKVWLSTATTILALAPLPGYAALLVGNTSGNNVVAFDEISGDYLGEFISAGSGLDTPDAFVYGPDGNLYISSGTTPENSGIFRFDGKTGAFIDQFATGGGLYRPYGLAFGPDDNLYVSSFLTDKILRYKASTGEFVDVFAAGNNGADPEGLNGPNGLLFGPDGYLYVTTQGSVAVKGQADFSFGYESQILRYDISTGIGEVFADQPDPDPDSFGFVSFLGMAIGPQDGTLYVSDYANGIRRYDFITGEPLEPVSTNFTGTSPSENFMGSLTFDEKGNLYTVGFDINTEAGSILKFDESSLASMPEFTLLANNAPQLRRPIGVLATSTVDIPEPSFMLGFVALAGGWLSTRRRQTG